MVNNSVTIAVWFSCGAASAIAAKLAVDLENTYPALVRVVILNNPIAEEDEDNQRFLKDVALWLNHPIEHVLNNEYPHASAVKVWDERQYMAGINGAPCTQRLKKHARQQWEGENHADLIALGFTLEEMPRHKKFTMTERWNVLPLLIEAKMTKQDCFNAISEAGLTLPRIYKLGYPNANCIGCVKASSPTYWNHVRKIHPETFNARAEQSRRLGAKLVRYKGKRIFLDELPINAVGRKMKNLKTPECGIFCEEK